MKDAPELSALLDAEPCEFGDDVGTFIELRERRGMCDGRHYTAFVGEVKTLKREGRLDQAEALLLRLLGAVEEESRADGVGVAPWYYEQLAIIYARRGEVGSEIEVLARFARQRHARGVKTEKLLSRLSRLHARARPRNA